MRTFVVVLSLAACIARAQATPPPEEHAPHATPWQDEILYFVMLDRFADGDLKNDKDVDLKAKGTFHGGDLKGLTQHLDEIASLGVTAIWITPVVKNIPGFVTGAGFPDWGYHGYWADDFYKLDPRFGTEKELKAFVAAAHKKKLKVLLDVVYNHAGYYTHYLKDPKTKDWLRSPDQGNCGEDELTTCLSGLPDFKTERPEVAKYLLDAQLGWAKKSGADGFRLDTFKHIDHPFWQEHRRRVRKELKPGFFLLGEVWGGDKDVLDPWFKADELDGGIDFQFSGSTIAFVEGRGRVKAYDHFLETRQKVRPGHLLAHFLSSHDVDGALFQFGGDVEKFKLAAALQLTTSGMPVIYYGEEVARLGGKWPDNRSDMPWGEKNILPGKGGARNEALRKFYVDLIAARRKHPALSRGTHTGLWTEGDVYAFARQDAASGDGVIVVINRGDKQSSISLKPLPEWGDKAIVEALSGKDVPRKDALEVEVAPRTALILTPR